MKQEAYPYHFTITTSTARVTFRECFGPADHPDTRPPVVKATLPRAVWAALLPTIRVALHARQRGPLTRVPGWIGKELTLLAWAAECETAPSAAIAAIAANWCGLQAEERWWLYATINATFGHPQHGPLHGWRGAIKQALRENPV